MSGRNLAASVRARLLNRARETGQDFNFILIRYALERLLYRLSISAHADQFLLKGALLFDLWFDIPHRPTRDADFLGLGSAELPHLETVFRDVCGMDTEDGVTFRPDTVQAAEIRKEANYAGVRVTLLVSEHFAALVPDSHGVRYATPARPYSKCGGGVVSRHDRSRRLRPPDDLAMRCSPLACRWRDKACRASWYRGRNAGGYRRNAASTVAA